MLTIQRLVLACCMLIPLLVPRQAYAADTWIEMRTPHFTIVSNDSEEATRAVISHFEQIRAIVQQLWPWAVVDADKPVMLIGTKNEATMKALTPSLAATSNQTASGYVAAGQDRHYIALRTDLRPDKTGTVNRYFTASGASVLLMLDSSFGRRLPSWLKWGLTDLFGNIMVAGDSVELGRIIPWYMDSLRQQRWTAINTLLTTPDVQSDPMSRAESWAIVHYLLYGDPTGARGTRFDQYVRLLHESKATATTFRELFGDPIVLQKEIETYLGQASIPFRRQAVAVRLDAATAGARQLSDGESASVHAAFFVASSRPQEAAAALASVRQSSGSLAAFHEADGLRLDLAGDRPGARAAFQRAIDLKTTSFLPYYRVALAKLSDVPDSDVMGAEQLFNTAVGLNARHAPSYSQLSGIKRRLGQLTEALRLAQLAVRLAPDDAEVRFYLALALGTNQQMDAALVEATQARALAMNDADRKTIDTLIAGLKQMSSAARQPGSSGAAAGIVGGLVDAPPPPPPPPTPAAAVRVGGAVRPPTKIKNVDPVYPAVALAKRAQGVVIIELILGTDGRVQSTRVLKSEPLLDQAALDAVRQWEFTPTLLDGVPQMVIYNVTVTFALRSSK